MFVLKIMGAASLLVLHVMLARLLDIEQYGIYVYVLSWIHLLTLLCLLGFQTSLLRFVAEYNIKQQWPLLRGIVRRSKQMVLGFSILVSLSGVFVVRLIGGRLPPEMGITFYLAFCVLPVLAFCQLQETLLRAFKYVIQSELLLRIIKPVVTVLFVIGLFLCIPGDLKARHAMTASLAAVFLATGIGAFFLRRLAPGPSRKSLPRFADKHWLQVSLPLLLIAGMAVLLNRTDIIMLGFFCGSKEVGAYEAATKISDLLLFPLTSVNTILAPMISELYHTRQKEQLQKTISFGAQATFFMTLIIGLFLFLFGKWILSLFGPAFIQAWIPLLLLLTGQMINSFSGPVGHVLTMSGHQNLVGIIFVAAALINIGLNLLLIPLLGLPGAAIATAGTMILWNLAMLIVVQYKMRINPTACTKPFALFMRSR